MILWRVHSNSHMLAFKNGWWQTVFSIIWPDNDIVKCQGHLCLIMKIGKQFRSLGQCTKVINVEPGQCRGDVRLWLPTGKVWRGGDGSFCGLWIRRYGRRSLSGKWGTRYQLLTGLHRDLQHNHYIVDRVIGGRKWGNIHQWAWCERHSNWHSNPTGVGNHSLQRHDTDIIPLWVEWYKCDGSLQQFDFWSPRCFELSRALYSLPQGNV